MSSKVVARRFAVNLAVGAAALTLPCCSTSPHQESDHQIESARVAQEASQYDRARTYAEMALESGRHEREARQILAEVARTRGVTMVEAGDDLRAHAAFLQAADFEPSPDLRGTDLIAAFEAASRANLPSSDRIDLALRALQDRPQELALHREIARLAEDSGRDQLAADHYLWLVSANPDDTDATLRLGIIYLEMERSTDAAAILSRLYRAQPQNILAAITLARAYSDLRDFERAEELFQDLAEQFPDHPSVLRHYADFEERRGQHHRAAQLRQRADQASPGIEQREMRPLR